VRRGPRRCIRRAPGAARCHRSVIVSGTANGLRGRAIWLKFATWILLALEFALAADIVRTAVAPTWNDIWKLAVIAVIRTMLNYFLARDIADFSKLEGSRQPQPAGPTST